MIPRREGRLGRISWAVYDWANSSYSAIISTFVFPAFFARAVVENETVGTTLWGNTVGTAGLVIAVGAPILGAIADQNGRRKPWLGTFTLLCVVSTAALWWVKPGSDSILLGMLLAGVATVTSEFAVVFYNAMLPTLTTHDRIGRWSGWAWGLGYVGGIFSLVIALYGFVQQPAFFDLPRDEAQHVRATFVLVGCWYALFALPLFLFTPDAPSRGVRLRAAIGGGIRQLARTLRRLRDYATIMRFLIARMIFIDGLVTIFAFGGVYAAGTFGMSEQQVLLFGIALNVTAGIGAASFAWIDDWIGSKNTILISLVGLIVPVTVVLFVESLTAFWIFGMLLGVFVGPVQAASRSYLARVAPEELRNEMFGLFAFSGKATSFAGPFLVGWITALFGSQRAGMAVIVVMLAAGFLLMLTVPAAGAKKAG